MQSAAVQTNYDHLDYGRDALMRVMRKTYDELIDFVMTPEFRAVMNELAQLSPQKRNVFVHDVLLNAEALRERDIEVPDGILIQRSAFGDRRPTLFVVKKFLPAEYSTVWQNVNITFDNQFADELVTRDAELCWRAPLSPNVQARAMATGVDLESV